MMLEWLNLLERQKNLHRVKAELLPARAERAKLQLTGPKNQPISTRCSNTRLAIIKATYCQNGV